MDVKDRTSRLPVAPVSAGVKGLVGSVPQRSRMRCSWILVLVIAAGFCADAQPSISAVLNGASFTHSIAPGSLVSLFGVNLAASQLTASSLPLPTQLTGIQVVIGGQPAPLYFVSSQQINFQVPFELTAGPVPLFVSTPQGQSPVLQLILSPTAPGLFTRAANGLGRALLFDSSFQQLDSPLPGNPITLYATGLGATVPSAQTGAGGSSTTPYNQAAVAPLVSIGGKNAQVLFAGLAPGFVGVYQLNVIVPQGIASDTIYITSGAATSTLVQGGLQIVSTVAACAAGPTLLGDVNGDGVVTQADVDQIIAWLSGGATALGCPANADANQDGVITAADADAIMARIAGTSRSLTVNLEGGLPGKVYIGAMIEIGVQEKFFPFHVNSGTVRVQSSSAGYDSLRQRMIFQTDGRSLYWHWQTSGLPEAADYQISVTLDQPGNLPPLTGANTGTLTTTVPLGLRPLEPTQLAQSIDDSAPTPGIALSFIRSWTHDSFASPALGPFGLGWKHSFEIHIREFTDGSVAFVAPGGVNRLFAGNSGGMYTPSRGDHGMLTLDPNGSFQLRETNGFLYRFRPDLLLDHVEDRNGNSIVCSYDTLGRLVTLQHSSGATFQLQYNTLGLISLLTDQMGRQTQYTYDASGTHLAMVTSTDAKITSYSYTQGLGVPVDDRLQVITFPDGTHLSIDYDHTGRFASSQLDGGTSKVVYGYPADGETTITDAGNGVTSIFVNAGLKPVRVVDPLGNVTQYDYDAAFNLVSTTDPLGRTQTFSHDNNGNVTQAVDPAGNQLSMTYDPVFNQLITLRDSRSNFTTFLLDNHGNVTKQLNPDGTAQIYTYDQFGLLRSHTDAKGQTVLYTYLTSGLLRSKTYPDQSFATYGYDAAGNLTSATDLSGAILLAYDTGNRLISKTYPGGRKLQFRYDKAGRRIQMTDADGLSTNYSYDNAGHLFQLSDNTGAAIVSYKYDGVSRVTQKVLGNGAYATYTYDLASRLQKLTNYAASGSVLSFFSYTYDADGHVLSKSTVEGEQQYIYDSLGQLTGVVYPDGTTAQYSYDSAGNRTNVTESGVHSAYVTDNRNRYQSAGGVVYSYDPDGNVTGQEPLAPNIPYSYSYDFDNRLLQAQIIQAQVLSGNVSYTYNALGERSSRTDSSGTVQYLWDGLVQAMEQTSTYQTIASYTWGRALDETIAMTRNGATYYYTQDALLSVSDLLDAAGRVTEHYTYSAFGRPVQTSNIGNPFFFTGARYDQATLLHSLGIRWYSASLGRFLTEDPLGLAAGVNIYRYAGNDPTEGKSLDDIEAASVISMAGQQLDTAPQNTPSWSPPQSVVTVDQLQLRPRFVYVGVSETNAFSSGAFVEAFLGAAPRFIFTGSGARTDINGGPFIGANWNAGFGQCPTFIQIRRVPREAKADKKFNPDLFGNISVPVNEALLRSDIPIFGVAGGTDFKDYRVEYGEGASPATWTLIQSSMKPEPANSVGLADIQHMQGDIDIRGNLATWNTGLKEWVHLPWHPPDDPTDLRGEYTVRLVVTGKDGKSVENRVHVEVGRVISQVLPGDVVSTDNRVTMHFEVQSLQAPFRVYTIKPLVNNVPQIPAGYEFVGLPYTVREPGDRFLKPVVLRFDLAGKRSGRDLSRLGIYTYDEKSRLWEPLPTLQGPQPDTLETSISSLPDPVAYFAILNGPGSRSLPKRPDGARIRKTAAKADAILVFNTFETDMGQWAGRDRAFGGTVARDRTSTPDGTYSLKITNQNVGGNFAVTAVLTPFRADTFPVVSFDYRIGPGIKTDFYARIGTRWYRIGFTGDEIQFRNTGVGISSVGRIDGIIKDGQWHSASFDLNRLLATKTARRDVEELIMADWRVGGYMKLEFGDNPRGASFFIDNFKIRRGEETDAAKDDRPKLLLVDDFDGTNKFNRLGGAYDVFSDPGTLNVSMARVPAGITVNGQPKDVLRLKYDVTRTGAYGGYWTQLRGAPGDEFGQVSMRVKSVGKSTGFLLGLKRRDGIEPKVSAELYWGQTDGNGWHELSVPLAAFGSPKELAGLELLSISFTNALGHGRGELLVSDIHLIREPTSVLIADFEGDLNTNRLMQKNWVFTHGAAALAVSSQRPDIVRGSKALRLSYGGTIGLDLGSGDFSYAGWVAGLGGIDAIGVQDLRFRVRGQIGGERFNIYLDDGNRRKLVDSSRYVNITKDWKEISIPLDVFAAQGVDISHLEELQFVFEWQQMSGTIYVDDIRLTRSEMAPK